MQSSRLLPMLPPPRVTGTDPAVFGPLLDPAAPPAALDSQAYLKLFSLDNQRRIRKTVATEPEPSVVTLI